MQISIEIDDKEMIKLYENDDISDLEMELSTEEWLIDSILSILCEYIPNTSKLTIHGFEKFKNDLKHHIIDREINNLKKNLEW